MLSEIDATGVRLRYGSFSLVVVIVYIPPGSYIVTYELIFSLLLTWIVL